MYGKRASKDKMAKAKENYKKRMASRKAKPAKGSVRTKASKFGKRR